jgi:hypothetical protein
VLAHHVLNDRASVVDAESAIVSMQPTS